MIVHQPIKPEPYNNLASGHISHLQCIQLNGYVNNLQVDTYPTCKYSIEWLCNNLQVDTYPTCNVFN